MWEARVFLSFYRLVMGTRVVGAGWVGVLLLLGVRWIVGARSPDDTHAHGKGKVWRAGHGKIPKPVLGVARSKGTLASWSACGAYGA